MRLSNDFLTDIFDWIMSLPMNVGALKYFILTSLILPAVTSFSQSGRFQGIVVDSITGKPIVGATLRLKSATSSLVSHAVTINDGAYSVLIDTGVYSVQLSHINYISKNLRLHFSKDTLVPTVYMLPKLSYLPNVRVTTQKRVIEQDGDKITFNLENDAIAKTETALDILRRTPFVSVDGNDQVRVNGQTSFKVFLNGRETSLFTNNVSEALRGLPGHLIVKIEVYPSPSAKFDGEGTGGIINIVTKKKLQGYSGSITGFVNTNGYYSTSVRFSAKYSKISLIGYYGYTFNPMRFDVYNQTIAKGQAVISQRTLKGTRNTNLVTPVGNGELVWEPDSLNIISFYNTVSGGTSFSNLDQRIAIQIKDSIPPQHIAFKSENDLEFPVIEVGLDYTKKFKRVKGQEFSFRAARLYDKNTSIASSELIGGSLSRYLKNNNQAENRQYTIQLDYAQPLTGSRKLEVGLKAINRRAFSDFSSMVKYKASEAFKANDNNTDNFDYAQNVLGAYAVYSFALKKTDFVIGTRVERTRIDGIFRTGNSKVRQDYTTVLPNFQVSRRLGEGYTVLVSYSKRLQRPFIWNLNPFINNADSFNVSFGDPLLDPQHTHQFTLQTRYSKGPTFVSVGLTGSYSDDLIIPYTLLNNTTGITSTTSGNIGLERQVGLLLNLNTKLMSSWSLSANTNLYYISTQNKLNELQKNNAIGTNGNVSTNYTFSLRFTILAYSGFSGYPNGYQSRQSINAWYGVGATYKLFQNKLTASLRSANFFTPNNNFQTTTNDLQFLTMNHNKLQTWRSVAIMLTWNFGTLKENVSKKKGVDSDDLLKQNQ